MSIFNNDYIGWRSSRIQKIISIYGEDYFKGKSILELGCGHGDVGDYFSNLGAIVTFAEGRQENLDHIMMVYPDAETILLDQDNRWNLSKKFDIIIHWGVLYHLNNWQQDLTSTLEHTNLLFLETEVPDSIEPNFELTMYENAKSPDQSLTGKSIRPSADRIENYLSELGAAYQRYDDAELNSFPHVYDWTVANTNTQLRGHRRFWIISR